MKSLFGLSKKEFFLVIIGILIVIYFICDTFYRKHLLENNAAYTMGQIVNSRIADGKLWFEYEFYVDSISYKGEVPEDGRVKVKIGDHYRVKYSKSKPSVYKIILYE